jgi:hypothetical protein
VDWRLAVSKYLNTYSIKCLNPLRGKEVLNKVVNGDTTFQAAYNTSENQYMGVALQPFITLDGIFSRDKFDIMRSDLLLVNFLGTEKVSIGSICEIAWGHLLGKYILIVMEPDNIHYHGFITKCASIVMDNLTAAVELIPVIFGIV